MVAEIETEYAAPCCPVGRAAGLMLGPAVTIRVTFNNPVRGVRGVLSATFTVNENDPAAVGVPLSNPVESSVSPSTLTLVHVYGSNKPPLAVNVPE